MDIRHEQSRVSYSKLATLCSRVDWKNGSTCHESHEKRGGGVEEVRIELKQQKESIWLSRGACSLTDSMADRFRLVGLMPT